MSEENWLEDLYEDMRRQAADPVNRAILRGQGQGYSGVNPTLAIANLVMMARIRHAALPWWRRLGDWLYWRTPKGRSEIRRLLEGQR